MKIIGEDRSRSRRGRLAWSARSAQAGLTLVEIVVALAVLGAMSAGCYIGLNTLNSYAISSRLYSEAEAAAHNQIDLILSKGPFNLGAQPTKVPIELMTTAELNALSPQPLSTPPPTTNQYYPYYRNFDYAGGPLAKQAFIYVDPVTGNVVVTGTLTSIIIDTGSTMTYAGTSANLNVRRAHVEVTYSYRNRDPVNNPTNYTVALDTMRTADQ